MIKYYIAYVYLDPVKGITFDSMLFDCDPISIDNLQQSMDDIKAMIERNHCEIESKEDIVINSWQKL